MIDSLISITENILADIPEDYLLFLQDMYSYCDRALLLDYKAELFLIKNDYKNALKKRLKAVSVLEPYHTEDAAEPYQYADPLQKYRYGKTGPFHL